MDTAQWPQNLGVVKPMEEQQQQQQQKQMMEKRVRPSQKEQPRHCPRCNSTNTKFCYYNNYSLTQPRYFCKTCRRYWTEGGTLRNVPVGGGSRKNKRSSSTSSSTAAAATTSLPTVSSSSSSSKIKLLSSDQNPKFHQGQDLNLAFPLPHEMGSNCNTATPPLSAMELLRSTGRISPLITPTTMAPEYPSGFDYMRPNTFTNFPFQGGIMENSGGRLLFPFENSETNYDDDQHNRSDPPGFWNGMIGGDGGGGAW